MKGLIKMSIYGKLVFESGFKSNIDKDFKSKGKKNLSSFKRIKITKEILKKYKVDPYYKKFLSHIDERDNGLLYFDKEDHIVGLCCVDENSVKPYTWITAIAVSESYKGYGLGKQLLEVSVKELKGNALTVAIDNQVAIKMYKDYGFVISKASMEDVKAGRRKVYYMYLPEVIPD